MEGFLPCTKSFWSDCQQCPWKAFQHKVHKIKSRTTKGAWIGRATHSKVTNIRRGRLILDQFMADPAFFLDSRLLDVHDEIAEMVQRAFTSDPIVLTETEKERVLYEQYFAIDDRAQPGKEHREDYHDQESIWPPPTVTKKNLRESFANGALDRLILRDNGSVIVDDLKTERGQSDNIFERILYVLGAKATYPGATVVTFGRHYLRTGTYVEWKYEFQNEKGKHTCIETTPEGEKITHGPFGQNPLLVYLKDFVTKIEQMEPRATPGPHCESWYGEPCQFLGNECPAAEELPAVIQTSLLDTAEPPGPVDAETLCKSEFLKAIAQRREGFVLTKEQAAWAYSAFIQFQGFTKALEAAIKEWSRDNGTFRVGATDYGWFTVPENAVDRECALSEMLRSMTVEEIAGVISISKSSINTKISKRKYPELREFLLSMAVSEVDSKPKFGALKNVEKGENDVR